LLWPNTWQKQLKEDGGCYGSHFMCQVGFEGVGQFTLWQLRSRKRRYRKGQGPEIASRVSQWPTSSNEAPPPTFYTSYNALILWLHKGINLLIRPKPSRPNLSKKHDSIWCPLWKVTNAETLKRQKPIEGDQELEKRSVREESTWNVTHMYIEAMLGLSLHSYPYLN
jgi:hypothetical protein